MQNRLMLDAMKDIPQEWFTRHTEEITGQLWDGLKDSSLYFRRRVAQLQAMGYPPYNYRVTIPNPRLPLRIHEVLPLFNVPAFCYLVRPLGDKMAMRAHHAKNFTVQPFGWVGEAFHKWNETAPNSDTARCDNKDPFGLVYCEPDFSTAIGQWLGLGVQSDLEDETQTAEARTDGLSALFQHHRQMCDHVRNRTHNPLIDLEERGLSHYYRYRKTCPVLSPVCSAVLLLTTERLQEERRVLLLLTGDNSQMLSTPTFESIQESEIHSRRGANEVEVSLDSAVLWLRHLDTEEEKVNDVLRQTTETRCATIATWLHEEAGEMVRCRGHTSDLGAELTFDTAVRKVWDAKKTAEDG